MNVTSYDIRDKARKLSLLIFGMDAFLHDGQQLLE